MSLQSMMHPSMQAQLEADLVANSKASGLQLLARSLTRRFSFPLTLGMNKWQSKSDQLQNAHS